MVTQLSLFDDINFNNTVTFNKKVRFASFFSGYDSQALALKRLGIEFEFVAISEIDKYALKVHKALFGEVDNLGAVGTFDELPYDLDLATWSFPCQDISKAGILKGLENGTRSNLGFIFLDTVKNTPLEHRPKVMVMENVKNLISKRFADDFEEILSRLKDMGYTSTYQVLNAKDYGIPQNRERVFVVSILDEVLYSFPDKQPLSITLKNLLEPEVDDKYFITEKMLKYIIASNDKWVVKKDSYINNSIAGTITTREGNTRIDSSTYVSDKLSPDYLIDKILINQKTISGYAVAEKGDGIYLNRPHQKRGVVQKGMIPTIKTNGSDLGVVLEDLKIRRLTPKECFRLRGLKDEEIDIILNEVSNSQAYKLAGNSIVVNVLVEIFRELFKEELLNE